MDPTQENTSLISQEYLGLMDIVRDFPFFMFNWETGEIASSSILSMCLLWYRLYDSTINTILQVKTRDDHPKAVDKLVACAKALDDIIAVLPDNYYSAAIIHQKKLHILHFANSYGASEPMNIPKEYWPKAWADSGNPYTGELP